MPLVNTFPSRFAAFSSFLISFPSPPSSIPSGFANGSRTSWSSALGLCCGVIYTVRPVLSGTNAETDIITKEAPKIPSSGFLLRDLLYTRTSESVKEV